MKIAVVGCGAVGSYYGARLALSRRAEVHFLLRSDFQAVKEKGVTIRDTLGNYSVAPRCARMPEEIGLSDLVVIALKSTANNQYPRLLPPLVGPGTAILTLQNGLGNEEQLAALFPPAQILGGLCFVCLNRIAPGVIHHIDHGQIIMGEFIGASQARTHAIAELFEAGGVPCKVAENLAQAHWVKLVWNIPFNGLGVAGAAGLEAVKTGILNNNRPPGPCLTTSDILSNAPWRDLARELMLEVTAVGRALGHDLPDTIAEEQLARTQSMGPYKASTLIDFEGGRPIELDSLFKEPLYRAQRAGISTPRLKALNSILEALDG